MSDQVKNPGFASKIWSGELETPSTPVSSTQSGNGPNLSESSQDLNIRVVQRIFDEVWNQGRYALIDELLAINFEDHSSPPGAPRGRKGYKVSVQNFRTAFPDISFTLDQVLAEGDRVSIRLTARGTHRAPFLGIPATNKQVSFSGMTFVRLENGKIVERWGISDMPSLMQQLGAGAPPKRAGPKVITMQPEDSLSTTRVLGVTNYCKATKNDTRGIYSFFVSTVPPGEAVPIHIHHKEDEAYYILSGTFEIYDIDNHETHTIGPDTYVYVPMGMNHGFKNVGDTEGRLVLIITPGGLEGFFEEIGQIVEDPKNPPPPPQGPPDFAKIAQIAAKYNISFTIPEGQGRH